jgi:SAM-dependent methyltransferase
MIDEKRLDSFAYASRKTPEYMHYRLIACPDCDLLYASPAPDPGELGKAYKDASYGSGEEARFASKTYSRLLAEFVARLPDRAGALDIGAGDGAFLHELLSLGFTSIAGVEPSEAPIAAASPDVRPLLKLGTFAAADFQAGAYSLITSFQTLEHVHDPLEVLRGAHGLLKDAGAVYVICHDRRALSARLLGLKSPIFDIEHLQLFSPESARALLERAGFEDVEVRPILNSYPIHYWLRLFPLPSSWKARVVSWAKGERFGAYPLALPAGNLMAIGFKRPKK